MKKIILPIILFYLLLFIIIPAIVDAQGIVPCGNPGEKACTITDFFTLLTNIYSFIIWSIATPLAIIAIIVGAIFMMISGGNPNLMSRGKEILKLAIIGLVLVFGSYLIIDFILKTLGFTQNWQSPF